MRTIIKIKKNRGLSKAGNLGDYARLAVPFLTLVIVLCIISYVALASLTMWNAQKIADFGKQISLKNLAITNLESKFSIIEKTITPTLAIQKGFEESSQTKFITAKPLSKTTSANEIEL